MALLSIPFTDLYLGETSSWMSGMPGTTDPEPPPEADLPELVALRTECEKYFVANPERESWPIRHAGISYRASLMNTISERVYVMRRLFALATGDNNSADDVLGMLASGLAGVLHQRLERTDKRKQLVVESLFCIGEDETSIRATIRQRNFEALKNTVALQKNRMFFGARKATA
ncbi:MAG: hypothetical protein Q7K57_58335 [Burkholderiaceae bacterium]|nr:hypothetical protein [Polaromonas sp.]MDO8778326.1 hypothetical protein [Burkholderiaceae bacterium]